MEFELKQDWHKEIPKMYRVGNKILKKEFLIKEKIIKNLKGRMARYFYALLSCLSLCCLLYSVLYVTRLLPSSTCSMSWSRPQYTLITSIDNSSNIGRDMLYPSGYNVYKYVEGKKFRQEGKNKKTLKVIFVPGHSGSYQQIRSIASRLESNSNNNNNNNINYEFYTFNFGEEYSGLSPGILLRESEFIYKELKTNKMIITNNKENKNIILIGHSMGGIVVLSLIEKCMIMAMKNNSFEQHLLQNIRGVILTSTPIIRPVFTFQNEWNKWYKMHLLPMLSSPSSLLLSSISSKNITMNYILSISGSVNDFMIEPMLSYYKHKKTKNNSIFPFSFFHSLLSTQCNTINRPIDHQATIWCHDLVEVIAYIIQAEFLSDSQYSFQALKQDLGYQYYKPIWSNFIDQQKSWDHNDWNIDKKYNWVNTIIDWNNNNKNKNKNNEYDKMKQQIYGSSTVKDVQLYRYKPNEDTKIVLICNTPITFLEICDETQSIPCTNYLNNNMMSNNIPVFLHYNFVSKLQNMHQSIIPRSIIMVSTNKILELQESKSSHYSLLQFDVMHINNSLLDFSSKCTLWQGLPMYFNLTSIHGSHSWYTKIPILSGMISNENQPIELSGHMFNALQITINPIKNNINNNSINSNYICINGFSGSQIAPMNGIYQRINNDNNTSFYFIQHLSYWYSPKWNFKDLTNSNKLYLYRFQNNSEDIWVFGTKLNSNMFTAYCEESNLNSPNDCKYWSVYENTYGGWFRFKNSIFMQYCYPNDLSLLRIMTKDNWFDSWFFISSIQSTTHTLLIPRNGKHYLKIILQLYPESNINNINEIDIHLQHLTFPSIFQTIVHDFNDILYIIQFLFCFTLIQYIFNNNNNTLSFFNGFSMVITPIIGILWFLFWNNNFIQSDIGLHCQHLFWLFTSQNNIVSWIKYLQLSLIFLYFWSVQCFLTIIFSVFHLFIHSSFLLFFFKHTFFSYLFDFLCIITIIVIRFYQSVSIQYYGIINISICVILIFKYWYYQSNNHNNHRPSSNIIMLEHSYLIFLLLTHWDLCFSIPHFIHISSISFNQRDLELLIIFFILFFSSYGYSVFQLSQSHSKIRFFLFFSFLILNIIFRSNSHIFMLLCWHFIKICVIILSPCFSGPKVKSE
ncbi:hypothetical protein RFI_16279 [Reticulomyxa filosa]|uniref:GPI inositol-deacylase n=1 Tax=Reticulomyxa filosa TaxID=46433 RepID=X6N4K5_RETFI|nr:hypothetical protein RFI_16279 [Reticulomyxa filosa]|eukprot:ETO20926.1 hypothetical protein RFI_16279 [Reticulomyxa filosa]